MALKLGTLFYDIGADTSGLKKAEKEVSRTTKKMEGSFSGLQKAIAAAISVEAARRVISIADDMKTLEARVRRLSGSQKEFNKTFGELFRISNNTGVAIRDTVTQFQRFKLASENIKATTEQTLAFTETIQKLGVLGGGTVQEVTNASIQLGQALAAGALRGDELRSVMEQMPEVAKLIEKEMGLLPGTIKEAAKEGRVTSDVVFKAILKQTERINAEFAKFPKTVERATTELKNGFALAVSEIDKMLGGSAAFADLISQIASFVQSELPDAFIVVSENINAVDTQLEGVVDTLVDAQEEMFSLDGAAFSFKMTLGAIKDALIELPSNIKGLATAFAAEEAKLEANLKGKLAVLQERIRGFFKPFSAKPATDLRIAEIERETKEKVASLDEITFTTLKNLDDEKAARKAATDQAIAERRRELDERRKGRTPLAGGGIGPAGGIGLGNIKPVAGVGDDNQSAIAKLRAELGGETEQIAQAFLERNARILEITKEGDEERRELQIANAERLNEDLAAMSAAQDQAALASLESGLDKISSLFRSAGKEGSAIAKAAFLAQKAIQVAQIIAATEVAAANASAVAAIGGPLAFFSSAVAIRAAGFASAGLVAGLAIGDVAGGGRQFGGITSPSLAHPINEGGTPEILEQAGKQFLLPNGKGGQVSPLGSTSAGQDVNITIISTGTPQTVSGSEVSKGEIKIMIKDQVRQSEDRINTSLATGRGESSRSLKQGFQVQRNVR